MKLLYKKTTVLIAFVVLVGLHGNLIMAQCPGGYTPGSTAFDTTIAFGTGVTSTPVKFPQFDPVNGTVNCVRLCITITGVIDTLAIENFSFSPQTANFTYDRTDQLTGPGLSPSLSNSITQNYGPYNLAANNGTMGSGPDFVGFGHDTVLNKQLCRTITDTSVISQFYGTDSVTYNYNISVSASAVVTGGSSFVFVLTSALVNFHFEYCYCPPYILPADIFNIKAVKADDNTAEIVWGDPSLQDNDYQYSVEVSPDGSRFYPVATVRREEKGVDGKYRYKYATASSQQNTYYFRVRIKYANGNNRISQIKTLVLGKNKSTVSVFPNPSDGIVGIKFDNDIPAKFNIQIVNISGQTVYNGNLDITGPTYRQITKLNKGMYWLRLTDVTSQLSGVNQLLIIK